MEVLIVIDMQNDFVSGALGTPEAQAIVPNVIDKIDDYHNQIFKKRKIIFTQDTHGDNYLETEEGKNLSVPHCLLHTEGWELISEIKDFYETLCDNEPIDCIRKGTFGSIKLPEALNQYALDIESIELIGLCTDICVISNAIIAKSQFKNIPIYVDASCCAGTTPEAHDKAIDLMKNSLQIHILNEGKEPWRK